ncbi:uncharacterized protein GIQ15_05928 [Arthroderma uncinatum]|uniref:uncharacterized protein n=1 Tax=Arthroderma uncinatum TaxID=74035 RepID=UPI00144AA9D3|nr:uncharacterized protein GIQ15_05928 [Arthroderma uncinatum]KAF3480581.1 hypothetical protein GIQ15_05928 [Arthroderma uncinatum]
MASLKPKLSLRPACRPAESIVLSFASRRSGNSYLALTPASGTPPGRCLGTLTRQDTKSRPAYNIPGQPQPQLSRARMEGHGNTPSRRLRAITSHISPSQTRSLSQSASTPSDIDFSALSKLLPHDGTKEGDALWYVVVAAALMAFHREAAVGALWEHIVSTQRPSEGEKAVIARRIRESCLKASVLVGFPRGINALTSLHASLARHTPSTHELLSTDSSLRSPVDATTKLERGTAFFTRLYAGHTSKILDSMSRSSGGDLSYYALASVYGELMAETRVVDAMETVVLEFVCCLADDVAPQAKGHFFGSRNMGASGKQIQGAVAIVQELARQAGVSVPGAGDEYAFLAKADSW